MHMRRFDENEWALKDMWDADVQAATSYEYSLLGERDIDWSLEDQNELAFDRNTRTLNCRFKRKLIGSSSNDYTMLLDQPLEIRWTFGEWANDEANEVANANISPKFVSEPRGGGLDPEVYKRNITLYTPTILSQAIHLAVGCTVMLLASII